MLTLRPYQDDGVQSIRAAYQAGRKAPLFVLPTGGGKTVVFSYVAASTSARGKKVLILVHRVELLKQTSLALYKSSVTHGLINPQFTRNLQASVQVCSVQTLVKRMHKYPLDPDLIIVDEAHHATAGTWKKILDYYPKARTLGVTATPIRTDGVGLGKDYGGIFDELIVGPSVSWMIENGFLVAPVIYAPTERIDLSGLKTTKSGDYLGAELEQRVDKPHITGNAVAHYSRLCPGTPAVVFCVSVLHAEHVANEFRNAGYKAYSVDGTTDDAVRKSLLNGLGNGSVEVLCTCDLVSEGTDIPAIGCAILLRPTQSEGLYLQQVGRALRPCAGKDRAIILDHVGNVITHGMPQELREWSLEGRSKKKRRNDEEKGIRVKQCPKCYAVHEPAPNCTQCGHFYEVEVRELEQREGELKEMTQADADALKRKRAKEVTKAKTLEDLQKLGEDRGYKPGWAKHIFESREKRAPVPAGDDYIL